MVARVTRALLLLQLLTAIGIGWVLFRSDHISTFGNALLNGLAIILLLRLLITANNFYLSCRYGSKTPPAHRLSWPDALRLFFTEFCASMISSSYALPFRTFSFHADKDSGTLPVLLVHGYVCNSGYWYKLSAALRRAKITHQAIDLEPLTASIDEYVPIMQKAVEQICLNTGNEKIVIVAHSMGGLVARAWIREYGTQRVARVITLGTPHAGTRTAEFGKGENCVEMHRQDDAPSLWLRQLATQEDADTRALFVSIYSHQDNIIAPQTSSHLSGAHNIQLHGIGHVALGRDPNVLALVIEEVRKTSTTTTLPS